MLLSNLEILPGKRVVTKHAGRDFLSGIKNIFGGELKAYTELLHDSREQATERLTAQAKSVGANAVLNIRFSTSSIAAGAAEIYVYGTAVELADE